jgi:hypothetical protein
MLIRLFALVERIALLSVAALLFMPALVMAADGPPPQHTLALPTDQLWTLLAGALVPLATYALNHAGPQVTEPLKAIVHVLVAAIAGGITQAIVAGNVGFNNITLQYVITAVVAALAAHRLLWLPSGISTRLGGGTNAA